MAKTPAKSGSNAGKGNATGGDDSYYSRLLIDKSRRSLITLAVILGFAVFCAMIARELDHPVVASRFANYSVGPYDCRSPAV